MRKLTLALVLCLAGCATQKEMTQEDRENAWRQSSRQQSREAWQNATGGTFGGGAWYESSARR